MGFEGDSKVSGLKAAYFVGVPVGFEGEKDEQFGVNDMYVAEISIIIKINSKMKRIGAQPVHLAKNKKKEKENISVLYEQPIDKENIDYDLMVFQESLKLNKH